jgi:hypothetical protein
MIPDNEPELGVAPMYSDDTFWGGLGHRALNVFAFAMGALIAAPFGLLIALPFFS